VQTRKLELIQKRIEESERLSARKKLTETEKELSSVIYEQTGSEPRSIFQMSTLQIIKQFVKHY